MIERKRRLWPEGSLGDAASASELHQLADEAAQTETIDAVSARRSLMPAANLSPLSGVHPLVLAGPIPFEGRVVMPREEFIQFDALRG